MIVKILLVIHITNIWPLDTLASSLTINFENSFQKVLVIVKTKRLNVEKANILQNCAPTNNGVSFY